MAPRKLLQLSACILVTLSLWSHRASARNHSNRSFRRLDRSLRLRGGSAAHAVTMDESAAVMTISPESAADNRHGTTSDEKSLLIVFSDLDGTLIHYPESTQREQQRVQSGNNNTIIQLPPSSTGMVGILSSETLAKCRQLRHYGIKLVLVSGMRSLTLRKRLPYLPKADAYCCEAGGRIYYPTTRTTNHNDDDDSSLLCQPVAHDGASADDLEPFYLAEDMEWRRRMEQVDAAGPDGFASQKTVMPVDERVGALWTFAKSLQKQGLVLDTKGYATCFRVNRSQQTDDGLFDKLLSGEMPHPPELASSVNLGCVDFYPNKSGKKHCCEYLAENFGGSKQVLSQQSVCICDDDNDVEMALACLHAYIPSISSTSMLATIQAHPTKFTLTSKDGREGVLASEAALDLILERIQSM